MLVKNLVFRRRDVLRCHLPRQCRGRVFPPLPEWDRRSCPRDDPQVDKREGVAHRARESWIHRERAGGPSWSYSGKVEARSANRATKQERLRFAEIPGSRAERRCRLRVRGQWLLLARKRGPRRSAIDPLRSGGK